MGSYSSDEHKIFRESVKSFVEMEVTPFVDKWQKEGTISRELFEACGKMGLYCDPIGFVIKF